MIVLAPAIVVTCPRTRVFLFATRAKSARAVTAGRREVERHAVRPASVHLLVAPCVVLTPTVVVACPVRVIVVETLAPRIDIVRRVEAIMSSFAFATRAKSARAVTTGRREVERHAIHPTGTLSLLAPMIVLAPTIVVTCPRTRVFLFAAPAKSAPAVTAARREVERH